ncbi:MAG: ATP-binding protein [Betaproteobacteria bacterium]|nr:ATP-binding protein [Betaproteobacteria bacterium]
MTDLSQPAIAPPAQELARALVRSGLARFAARRLPEPAAVTALLGDAPGLEQALGAFGWDAACRSLASRAAALGGPLGRLLRDFQLQLHECFLLALAGEVEADPTLALALAELQAPARQPRPGVHLCMDLCAELFGAQVTPLQLADHALAHAGLWRVEGEGGMPLALHTLTMPPRLWGVLCGTQTPWPGCTVLDAGAAALLPAALRAQFPQLALLLRGGAAQAVAFRGARGAARLAAAQLGEALGLLAVEVPLEQWEGQPALATACRYAGWLPVLTPRLGPGEQFRLARHGDLALPVALALGREGAVECPGLVEIDLPALDRAERRAVWQGVLGDVSLPAEAELAQLDGPAIQTLAERALLDARRLGEPLSADHVAHARGLHGADRLRLLAQPVHRRVDAQALVLPGTLKAQFDDLVMRCLRREHLAEGLGVTLHATASPGVRALFTGESGTGKSLAASHLATRLSAPLYRVDLSAVMNKYVGESEKNLGLVLDEAAANDVILLLDEADALFGRRSDGGETGERYANMLTNFLLTRIESHPGIVVLTSNSRSRIDPAFTRRLDAILEFPLPGGEERLLLWAAHLGERSPGEEAVRPLAAYSDLAGGHIRNAVLNAAARGPLHGPLEASLLVAALGEEYRKLGRELPPQLRKIGG